MACAACHSDEYFSGTSVELNDCAADVTHIRWHQLEMDSSGKDGAMLMSQGLCLGLPAPTTESSAGAQGQRAHVGHPRAGTFLLTSALSLFYLLTTPPLLVSLSLLYLLSSCRYRIRKAIAAIGELQDALMEQLDDHQDVLALAAAVGAPLDPTRSPSNGRRARGAVTRVNEQRMFGEEVYAAGGGRRPDGVATSSSSSAISSSLASLVSSQRPMRSSAASSFSKSGLLSAMGELVGGSYTCGSWVVRGSSAHG